MEAIRRFAASKDAHVTTTARGLVLHEKPTSDDHPSSLSVEWFDTGTVRIRAGSVIDLLVETAEEGDSPGDEILRVLEALVSGHAEEVVDIAGSDLIGLSWRLWHSDGERSGVVFSSSPQADGESVSDTSQATRRLSRWR